MAKSKVKTEAKKTPAKKPALTNSAKHKKPAAKKMPAKMKSPAKNKIVKSKAAKKPVAAKPVAPVAKRKAGLPEQLRDAALKILDERQAEDIITFDLAGRSSIADYLIIASGRATRQLSAIAHYLTEALEKLGGIRARVEGLPEANWVLIDGGDIIVHLFLPEVRGFYKLEEIWGKRG